MLETSYSNQVIPNDCVPKNIDSYYHANADGTGFWFYKDPDTGVSKTCPATNNSSSGLEPFSNIGAIPQCPNVKGLARTNDNNFFFSNENQKWEKCNMNNDVSSGISSGIGSSLNSAILPWCPNNKTLAVTGDYVFKNSVTNKWEKCNVKKSGFTLMTPFSNTSLEGFDIKENYEKISPSATVKRYESFRTMDYNYLTGLIPNVPLQTWMNVLINVNDKSMDIYINGKLSQSYLASFIPNPMNSSITVAPENTFVGWTSNLQYYPNSVSPQDVWNIYSSGYGGNSGILSSLGKYSMKVIFVDNSQTPPIPNS